MRIAAITAVLLFSAGCSLTEADDGLPFENVPEAANLQVREPGTAVFNDEASWEAFWAAHYPSNIYVDPLPAPVIDFEQKTAAAVFLGTGSGCSNAVEVIREVRVQGNTALVEVGTPRGSEGVTCAMEVYPLHVVSFDKAEDVRFAGRVPGEE